MESTENFHILLALHTHILPHCQTREVHCYKSKLGFTLIWNAVHYVGFDKCVLTCIHHYSIVQSSFTACKVLSALTFHDPLSSEPRQQLIFLLPVRFFFFFFFQNTDSWNHMVCVFFFSDCLSYLIIMHLSSVHAFSCLVIYFFLVWNNS